MKPFLVYTALRLGLFLAVYAILAGLAVGVFDAGNGAFLWLVIAAAVISAVLSLRLLAGPRERFAAQVQARAERAAARFEDMKSREDADEK